MAILAAALLSCGCASLGGGGDTATRIVPAFGFTTSQAYTFRADGTKPRPHVIWGEDVPDGIPCRILIHHTERAVRVYEYRFTYSATALDRGLNYQAGQADEPDPSWNVKPGLYLIELYAGNRRVATSRFKIIP